MSGDRSNGVQMPSFMQGLNDAIYQPIKEDMRDAYYQQAALRKRYPAGNSALNFIPTPLGAAIGAAANIDDVIHDDTATDVVMDTGGVLMGANRLHQGADWAGKTLKAIPKGLKGKGAVILGAGPLAYLRGVAADQEEANAKYQDRSMKDIADEIKRERNKD